MDVVLRLEEERDQRAVEELTREAFWNVYNPGCSEHLILHQLRKSPAFVKALDFVAELDGRIVGNIVYTRGTVRDEQGRDIEVIDLGPISVAPSHQRRGVGSRLVEHTIALAGQMGFRAIVIFGNPAHYRRFWFESAARYGISTSGGENFDAFMALELSPGSQRGVSGRFLDDPAFSVDEAELALFDSTFPPREKKVTATQLPEAVHS